MNAIILNGEGVFHGILGRARPYLSNDLSFYVDHRIIVNKIVIIIELGAEIGSEQGIIDHTAGLI